MCVAIINQKMRFISLLPPRLPDPFKQHWSDNLGILANNKEIQPKCYLYTALPIPKRTAHTNSTTMAI